MSHDETDRIVNELVARACALLRKYGRKRTVPSGEIYAHHYQGDFLIKTHGDHLWISISGESGSPPPDAVLDITDEGTVRRIDTVECARALAEFRQAMVLDDIAEVSEA